MPEPQVAHLEVERYRGALSPELCGSQQQLIARLLAECKVQAAEFSPDAKDDPLPAPIPGVGIERAAERDLLERRIEELEAAAKHLERLTELGQVVSGMLHELIQPLAAISNYVAACQCLLERGENEQIEHGLKEAKAQAVRAREIIAGIREFVK